MGGPEGGQPVRRARQVEVRPERRSDERDALAHRRIGDVTQAEVEQLSDTGLRRPAPADLQHPDRGVDAGHRWVLHGGDAFFHCGTLDGESRVPRIVTTWEALIAFDRKRVHDNHARLTELYRRGDADLLIVCAHDPTLFQRAQATA